MDGNRQANDSSLEKASTPGADLTGTGFTLADQRDVVKMSHGRESDSDGLVLDNAAGRSAKFEQPHNWYASSSKSYGLPASSETNAMDPVLKAGWRTICDKH